MNYILTMTLSGSCMFFLYLFQKYTIGKHLAKRWQYLFLKAVMLYYLIPLPYLAVLYRKIIKNVFPGPASGFAFLHDKKVVYLAENHFVLSQGYQRRLAVAGLWFLVAGILFTLQFIRYIKARRKILKHGSMDISAEHMNILENRKKQLHIRKNIALYTYSNKNVAFTMGIRKPAIICSLPEDPLEKEMLLGHELTHVKRFDIFWKMAESIVLALHWFNPVVYWFLNEFASVCETSCDEQVIKEYAEEERLQYASMLVKRAVRNDENNVWRTSLSIKGKKIVKRMEFIMEYGKEKHKLNGISSILLICILIVLNSLTVFAYEEVSIAPVPSWANESKLGTSDLVFVPTGEQGLWTDIILYEEQFVDEDDNIYPIYPHEETDIYANCNHTYQPGLYKKHDKREDNQCTILYDIGKRCRQCGHYIFEQHASIGSFSPCIH